MGKKFQILALDGGGIKGIFSSAILANIEKDLQINIADHFDLIVGTSTGGIIAIGLGIGYKPNEILDFYISNHKKIFRQNFFSSIRHFYKSKYSSKILEIALKEYFEENRLAECKKRLVIPSYNLSADDVYLFKTPHNKRLRRDYNVPLWQVAMATSAAPTYFPSFRMIDNIRLIDGGVWANNPSLVGITEAISLLDVNIEDIKIFSLGTTSDLKNRSQKLNEGGLWDWKFDGASLLMHSQSLSTSKTVSHIIGDENILRIDPIVPDGLFKLDKLNSSELIARASHHSRIILPKVEKQFIPHIANEYRPLYK